MRDLVKKPNDYQLKRVIESYTTAYHIMLVKHRVAAKRRIKWRMSTVRLLGH